MNLLTSVSLSTNWRSGLSLSFLSADAGFFPRYPLSAKIFLTYGAFFSAPEDRSRSPVTILPRTLRATTACLFFPTCLVNGRCAENGDGSVEAVKFVWICLEPIYLTTQRMRISF